MCLLGQAVISSQPGSLLFPEYISVRVPPHCIALDLLSLALSIRVPLCLILPPSIHHEHVSTAPSLLDAKTLDDSACAFARPGSSDFISFKETSFARLTERWRGRMRRGGRNGGRKRRDEVYRKRHICDSKHIQISTRIQSENRRDVEEGARAASPPLISSALAHLDQS